MSSLNSSRRICFVGPMVGRNPGYVTSQGQILADLFADAGYPVRTVSPFRNRFLRLIDIAAFLLRHRSELEVVVIEVYSGRAFLVADVASLLGRLIGAKVILWLHGGALPTFMKRHPKWSQRVLSRGLAVVSPSRYLARAAEELGVTVEVIPNVLDLSLYPFRIRETPRPRLFWMRSFHPVWNPELAVRVLRRVRQKFPDAELIMAGQDKGTEAAVKELATTLGVRDSIRFPGFLDGDGKAKLGSQLDIYLNTNRIDNTPVAVLEACAMGLPVVSTDVGGVADLLTHGETGLLVPDDDDKAMAQAVEQVLTSEGMAARLSRNGRRLAEDSSWDVVRPRWDETMSAATDTAAELQTVPEPRYSQTTGST